MEIEAAAPQKEGTAVEPTTEAPVEPEVRPHRAPGRRYVYKRWCKGCGICVAFCPQHVFALGEDGRAEVVNPEACTNCQICDRLCPDFAITLTPWEDKYGEMFTPTSLGQDKAEGSRGAIH
ncbi:MAG: 4Fe-4S dicluster domain-containing protein [Chloroflexia bacterium]